MRPKRSSRGQAAVEVLALLPALVLVTVICLAVALAAARWVSAVGQARSAARAAEVGAPPARAVSTPRLVAGALGPLPLPPVRAPAPP